jgi:hypothetical protein
VQVNSHPFKNAIVAQGVNVKPWLLYYMNQLDSMLSVNPEADIDGVEKIKMSTPAWNRTQINNP